MRYCLKIVEFRCITDVMDFVRKSAGGMLERIHNLSEIINGKQHIAIIIVRKKRMGNSYIYIAPNIRLNKCHCRTKLIWQQTF